MERLTQTSNSGGIAFTFDLDITCQPSEARKILNLATKLKDYEDLEEQGRLIKIPLEAYCIVDFKVLKGFVLEETYHMGRKPLLVVRYDDNSLKSHRGYLGISVFITQAEAEQKLKEMEND